MRKGGKGAVRLPRILVLTICYLAQMAVTCAPCLAGTRYTAASAAAGGQVGCLPCLAGQYSNVAATACTSCPGGRFDDDAFPATRCISCVGGQYSARLDAGAGTKGPSKPLPRSWDVFPKRLSQTRMSHSACETTSLSSHCRRASLRLPLPPAARIC